MRVDLRGGRLITKETEADRVTVGLYAVDQSERLHVLDDLLPDLEAVHARVPARERRHLAVEPDDRPHRKAVPLADLEVRRVVAGGDLDDAGPELGIDGGVGDDADLHRPVHRLD